MKSQDNLIDLSKGPVCAQYIFITIGSIIVLYAFYKQRRYFSVVTI